MWGRRCARVDDRDVLERSRRGRPRLRLGGLDGHSSSWKEGVVGVSRFGSRGGDRGGEVSEEPSWRASPQGEELLDWSDTGERLTLKGAMVFGSNKGPEGKTSTWLNVCGLLAKLDCAGEIGDITSNPLISFADETESSK